MSEIFLVGRPNVGKSYIFNAITDSHQKIANFAGVTVERMSKLLKDSDITITDLPGLYALSTNSAEEAIAFKHLQESAPDDLICLVVEGLKIKSQAQYILEVKRWCEDNLRPMALCLNMKDEADKFDIQIDIQKIKESLNLDVFFVSAKTGESLEKLVQFFNAKRWHVPESIGLDNFALRKKIDDSITGDLTKVIKTQNQIDNYMLSPIIGPLIFFLFTFILFQSIFSWAEPFMSGIENLIGSLASLVSPHFTGFLSSFLDNAIFSGFGAFLVFTPQIFILTMILTFLEKSGYMARAVLLCHQPLSWFGLHGKSFIPLMTGHACAVPAIYSARNIENPWVRRLTVFVVPLTACSARIPVYALIIKLLIPNKTILFGLLGLQGLVFFFMYFFGIFLALFISAVITKVSEKDNRGDDFIVELPLYRWPEPGSILRKSSQTTIDFIKDAGPIIFILNAFIWALSYFPQGSNDLRQSFLAQIGKFIEPVFSPIGLDWIQGVAVLSSFVAREVFVSTLGLLYGIEGENTDQLFKITEMQSISLASGLSLLFFFAIALQCMSTVSVMAKESSSKLAYSALLGYLILAYLVSLSIYQGFVFFG